MEVRMDSPNKLQKYKSTKSTKKVHKYKSTHNSVIFWATDSRFCIEVRMHCPTKWESKKVQKYKITKIQKYKIKKYKNTKVQNKKVQKYKSTE